MKKSTKTLIYAIAIVIVAMIGLTIYVTVTAPTDNKPKKVKKVENQPRNHEFTSVDIDSLVFSFPRYGHAKVTIMPGESDTIIFADERANDINVTQSGRTIKVATDEDFQDHFNPTITVSLKNLPKTFYSNGIESMTLSNIKADSINIDTNHNLIFKNSRLKKVDIKLASDYGAKCVISGADSSLGITSLTSLQPILVGEGLQFESILLIGDPSRADDLGYHKREEILRGGPLILFEGATPPIKIAKATYPFGVYIDGPAEVVYQR